MYECDGCGRVGTEPEMEAHIDAHIRWPDGTLKDPADVVCWGLMEVGGQAWIRFHTEGAHPMDAVFRAVDALASEFMIEEGDGR